MFSFTARKKQVEAEPYVRRMCDLTVPNFAAPSEEERCVNRHNRAIPTLLCPYFEQSARAQECTYGMTKDVSEHGVGVVLNEPCHWDELVLGFWLPGNVTTDPWYFLGTATRSEAIGGGFWLLGVQLVEFLNDQYKDELLELLPFAQRLLPSS